METKGFATHPPAGAPSAATLRLVLLAGVLAISTAAVLIRRCEAPSLAVAAWRMGLAAAALLPIELLRSRKAPPPQDLGWCALSGLFLALHFAAWISSLSYTSVASSVVLVTTNPLFVGLFSHWVMGDRLRRSAQVGMAVAMAGAALIGWGDFAGGANPLLGDALALLGAVAASAYLLAGRHVRPRLGTRTYAAWVYGWAAAFLLAAAFVTGTPMAGYSADTYLYLGLLALVPQLIGHTILNWALAHLPAPTVAVVILGEPVGATLLAVIALGEAPAAAALAGGLLVLTGITLTLHRPGAASTAR